MEVGQADQLDKKLEQKSNEATMKVVKTENMVNRRSRKVKPIKGNSKAKTRHVAVLRRRLKKWVDSSKRGNIIIETLAHPLKDCKALISLHQ